MDMLLCEAWAYTISHTARCRRRKNDTKTEIFNRLSNAVKLPEQADGTDKYRTYTLMDNIDTLKTKIQANKTTKPRDSK